MSRTVQRPEIQRWSRLETEAIRIRYGSRLTIEAGDLPILFRVSDPVGQGLSGIAEITEVRDDHPPEFTVFLSADTSTLRGPGRRSHLGGVDLRAIGSSFEVSQDDAWHAAYSDGAPVLDAGIARLVCGDYPVWRSWPWPLRGKGPVYGISN